MKTIYAILLLCLFSCSKNKHKDPQPQTCIAPEPTWLTQKKAEYASCVCLTKINEGTYNNQLVYEIVGYDPLCDGINMVYKGDGTQLLTSADLPSYVHYRANVTNVHMIWTCTK